jgi:hypothetical protein
MALGGTGFNSPGPFMASNWISGWTVTIKGWSDKADDLFGTTVLSRGEFGISIMDGSGNVLASSSKNMYPPYTRHGGFYEDKPATFTWSFDNPEGALYSPCIDYYFSVGGGSVIYFQYLKAVEVTPIYGANPAPPEQPPESGPGTTGGSGGSGGSTDPNLPRNGSGAPIPKGTPLTAPTPPDSGDGSDGRGTPKTGPASGGPTGRPAVGFAPDEVPVDGPVDIQSSGNLDGFEGLTPGLPVYLDPASSGGITQTKPSCAGCIQQELGTAADSTSIDIEIGPAIKRL